MRKRIEIEKMLKNYFILSFQEFRPHIQTGWKSFRFSKLPVNLQKEILDTDYVYILMDILPNKWQKFEILNELIKDRGMEEKNKDLLLKLDRDVKIKDDILLIYFESVYYKLYDPDKKTIDAILTHPDINSDRAILRVLSRLRKDIGNEIIYNNFSKIYEAIKEYVTPEIVLEVVKDRDIFKNMLECMNIDQATEFLKDFRFEIDKETLREFFSYENNLSYLLNYDPEIYDIYKDFIDSLAEEKKYAKEVIDNFKEGIIKDQVVEQKKERKGREILL